MRTRILLGTLALAGLGLSACGGGGDGGNGNNPTPGNLTVALTAVPARLEARRPIAEILRET